MGDQHESSEIREIEERLKITNRINSHSTEHERKGWVAADGGAAAALRGHHTRCRKNDEDGESH